MELINCFLFDILLPIFEAGMNSWMAMNLGQYFKTGMKVSDIDIKIRMEGSWFKSRKPLLNAIVNNR